MPVFSLFVDVCVCVQWVPVFRELPMLQVGALQVGLSFRVSLCHYTPLTTCCMFAVRVRSYLAHKDSVFVSDDIVHVLSVTIDHYIKSTSLNRP